MRDGRRKGAEGNLEVEREPKPDEDRMVAIEETRSNQTKNRVKIVKKYCPTQQKYFMS